MPCIIKRNVIMRLLPHYFTIFCFTPGTTLAGPQCEAGYICVKKYRETLSAPRATPSCRAMMQNHRRNGNADSKRLGLSTLACGCCQRLKFAIHFHRRLGHRPQRAAILRYRPITGLRTIDHDLLRVDVLAKTRNAIVTEIIGDDSDALAIRTV